MKGRAVVYAAGLALIAVGLRGVLANVGVPGWALWFAGAAVLHDGVLAPAVLLAGLATTWLPGRYRWIARAALALAGTLTLVALPVVLGFGRVPDTPSRLPLPYGRNLMIVLAVIAVAAAVAAVTARLLTGRRAHPKGEGPR
ncbi:MULTISPECIES: hypothetical protein [Thermomonosporaceae]|uniref:hypothetical protein n=1 Tax=Thermomonosporaceae TaxID=2012 RepID=UPI00255B2B0B|nr:MULTISPECIES: hypothetical protein [Thermomonosporaceae]MDL4776912.1 hypothetical protein [Actinomadura xylanilytica]